MKDEPIFKFYSDGECKLITVSEPMTQDQINELADQRWKLIAAFHWNGQFYFYFRFTID